MNFKMSALDTVIDNGIFYYHYPCKIWHRLKTEKLLC